MEKLRSKAYAEARIAIRNKLLEMKGLSFDSLTEEQTTNLEEALNNKSYLIKELAEKKMSATTSKLNAKFSSKFKKGGPESKRTPIIQHNRFDEELEEDTAAYKSLCKKSDKYEIPINTIAEVYNRGWNAWDESKTVSQQQYAFARVNSYINQGKTYFKEDADLHEGKLSPVNESRGPSPTAGTRLVSKHDGKDGHHAEVRYNNDWQEYSVHHYHNGKHLGEGPVSYHGDGKDGREDATDSAEHAVKTFKVKNGKLSEETLDEARPVNNPMYDASEKQWDKNKAEWEQREKEKKNKKDFSIESNNTPYVKPHFGDPSNKERQTGWKASNRHGKLKFFGMDFKQSANKHAGLTEDMNEEASPTRKIHIGVTMTKGAYDQKHIKHIAFSVDHPDTPNIAQLDGKHGKYLHPSAYGEFVNKHPEVKKLKKEGWSEAEHGGAWSHDKSDVTSHFKKYVEDQGKKIAKIHESVDQLDERNTENKYKKDLYVAKLGLDKLEKTYFPTERGRRADAVGHDHHLTSGETVHDRLLNTLRDAKVKGRSALKSKVEKNPFVEEMQIDESYGIKMKSYPEFKDTAQQWADNHTSHGKPVLRSQLVTSGGKKWYQTKSIGELPSGKSYIIGVFNHSKGKSSDEGHGHHHHPSDGLDESVEINELSKNTLNNYVNKAEKEYNRISNSPDVHPDEYVGNTSTMSKRARGINSANDKLKGTPWGGNYSTMTKKMGVKESTEINELSKELLKRYVAKGDKSADKILDKTLASYKHASDLRSYGVDNSAVKTQILKDTDDARKLGAKYDKRVKYLNKADAKIAEEITEVSKDTLFSYAQKAAKDVSSRSHHTSKYKKRLSSIKLAVDKMTSEDTTVANKQPVLIPAHKDAHGNTIPAKTVMRKSQKKIIDSGNLADGEPGK